MTRPFALAGPWVLALAACVAPGLAGCAREAAEPPPPRVAERPAWKPPAPPAPPAPCGPGCLEGEGNATVRFQLAGGDHTATAAVQDNQGVFSVSPPVGIVEHGEEWSGITTFFVPESGVQTLQIRATGNWTLTILKGKQSYADGHDG